MLIGTINIAMQASTQALAKGLDSARSSLAGFGKSVLSLKGLITGSFAGAGIAALGHFASLADDLSDNVERLGTMFGDSASVIVAQAELMNKAFGVSEITFTSAATKMGGLFKSMGVTEEASAEMTNQLLTMVQAIAQFKGIGFDAALTKVAAGMMGKGKGLKEFGISVTATMSAQERFNAIMSGGANILGTMDQRAMDAGASWASLKGRIEQVEISLGQVLPEMVEPFFAQLNVAVVAATDYWKDLHKETDNWGTDTLEAGKKSAEGMSFVQKGIGFVADALSTITLGFKAAQSYVTSYYSWLTGLFGKVGDFFTSVGTKIGEAFNNILDWLHSFALVGDTVLEGFLRPINDLLSGKVGAEFHGLADRIEGMKIQIAEPIQGPNMFTEMSKDLNDLSGKQWEEFQNKLRQPWPSETIDQYFDNAKKQIQEARQEITKGALQARAPVAEKAKKPGVAKAAGEALLMGSKEAASAIIRSKFEIGTEKDMKKLAHNSDKQVQLLTDIKANLEAGTGEPEMMDAF